MHLPNDNFSDDFSSNGIFFFGLAFEIEDLLIFSAICSNF